jgi:hypothetical protein
LARATAAAISRGMIMSIAFNACGLFSVMVATLPAVPPFASVQAQQQRDRFTTARNASYSRSPRAAQ